MMSTTGEPDGPEGVECVRDEDGSVTARDLATGLARGGATRAEALAQLAEVLALEEGRGEPIDDPETFLSEELGLDSDEDSDDGVPDERLD